MQYQHIGYGIKGFYRLAGYAISNEMDTSISTERLKVLEFWTKHGLQAAIDHSGKSKRTLYNGRKKYQDKGLNGLVSRSTARKQRRRRNCPIAILKQMRYWRTEPPNLGKEQMHVL